MHKIYLKYGLVDTSSCVRLWFHLLEKFNGQRRPSVASLFGVHCALQFWALEIPAALQGEFYWRTQSSFKRPSILPGLIGTLQSGIYSRWHLPLKSPPACGFVGKVIESLKCWTWRDLGSRGHPALSPALKASVERTTIAIGKETRVYFLFFLLPTSYHPLLLPHTAHSSSKANKRWMLSQQGETSYDCFVYGKIRRVSVMKTLRKIARKARFRYFMKQENYFLIL